MRKLIIALSVMLVLLIVATFAAYNAGIQHAIHTATPIILEFYDEESPYDCAVMLEIDGEFYEYDGYIG